VGARGDLWFAVEGAPPFGRGDPAATVAAILHDPPGRPARAGPLAPALEALLTKAPERRPAGAALRRLLAPAARGGPNPTAPLRPDQAAPTQPLRSEDGRPPGWLGSAVAGAFGATAPAAARAAAARGRRRARRSPSRARFIATRRTHCSGALKSRTVDQRAEALANASWTASSASRRSPVTRYT
jgi:hypothetical protein